MRGNTSSIRDLLPSMDSRYNASAPKPIGGNVAIALTTALRVGSRAAGPVFETALSRLKANHEADQTTMKRLLTDQAGMAYGISGDLQKARSIFEKAIAEDPEYPLYYYNLACADAEEKDLVGAQKHLREAFGRKANFIAGEKMPDPTADDSFLPYRHKQAFWSFVEELQAKQ